MLRLLHSGNPFAFLFLLIYFIALNIHPYIAKSYGGIQMHTAFFEWLFITKFQMQHISPVVIYYITASCIFVQGILISVLLRFFKIIPKFTLIPAAISYILFYVFDELIVFTPLLILNFLLLALLSVLFNAYNQKKADKTFFNTGLINGAMALLYFPSIIYSVYTMYSVFILRSSSFREMMIFVTGIITFLFLVFTACFWFDNTALLTDSVIIPFSETGTGVTYNLIAFIKICGVLCFLIPAMVFVNNRSSGNLIQIRKYLGCILMYLIFSIAAGFLYTSIRIPAFTLAIIPAAIIISYQLSLMKNRDTAEMLHITMLGIVFTFQYINFA